MPSFLHNRFSSSVKVSCGYLRRSPVAADFKNPPEDVVDVVEDGEVLREEEYEEEAFNEILAGFSTRGWPGSGKKDSIKWKMEKKKKMWTASESQNLQNLESFRISYFRDSELLNPVAWILKFK